MLLNNIALFRQIVEKPGFRRQPYPNGLLRLKLILGLSF